MSEQSTDVTETETEGKPQQAPTVEELEAKLDKYKGIAAEQEKRAKANASAAKRLAEFEESQKSDTEKVNDRISKAEAEAATVPQKVSDALRAHLVTLHEIDADDAELFLTATDPELLLRQVTRLVGQSGTRKKQNYAPKEGNTPSTTGNDETAFVRDLFGSS